MAARLRHYILVLLYLFEKKNYFNMADGTNFCGAALGLILCQVCVKSKFVKFCDKLCASDSQFGFTYSSSTNM